MPNEKKSLGIRVVEKLLEIRMSFKENKVLIYCTKCGKLIGKYSMGRKLSSLMIVQRDHESYCNGKEIVKELEACLLGFIARASIRLKDLPFYFSQANRQLNDLLKGNSPEIMELAKLNNEIDLTIDLIAFEKLTAKLVGSGKIEREKTRTW